MEKSDYLKLYQELLYVLQTYLILKSSSGAGNRLNDGSICDTRVAAGTFEALLNCCRRDHKSLYSRRSFGYSPSNACFKNVDARKTVAKKTQKDIVLVGQIEIPVNNPKIAIHKSAITEDI